MSKYFLCAEKHTLVSCCLKLIVWERIKLEIEKFVMHGENINLFMLYVLFYGSCNTVYIFEKKKKKSMALFMAFLFFMLLDNMLIVCKFVTEVFVRFVPAGPRNVSINKLGDCYFQFTYLMHPNCCRLFIV